jgi:hypothetical protein
MRRTPWNHLLIKLTLEDKQKVAEEIVGGPIEWEDDRGYFTCPMMETHTTPTKDNHSVVYLDDVPTFYCWHTSCLEWYENANLVLRQSCDGRSPEERRAGKQQRKGRQEAYFRALKIKSEREEIYATYNWDAIFESPLSSWDSWAAFLELWSPDDVIWVGDFCDTGAGRGGTHFRRVEDWHTNPINLRGSRFTCASIFLPSTVDRINKAVKETKYLVVEFDSLDQDKGENRRKGAALLNYLRQSLDLRMVVDSGNKSLHGWFEMNEKITEERRSFLRQLGADINAMRPSQPVRLPGAIRDNGNVQAILWLP